MINASLFSPPLYMQRYQFVTEFVKRHTPRKVMDLGCANCSLLRKLKFHRHSVEVLVGVDLDSAALRERIIEHLELWEVERFSDVVFGYMTPCTVIVSTPNVEFNSLLPGLRGFRNKDHKFEWTRAEFQTWALGVCGKYGYSVEFTGVGEAPVQDRQVGFCTQIGVFRKDFDQPTAPMYNNTQPEPTVYQLLYKVVYPSLCDNNIFQRTLVNEVLYKAEILKRKWLEEDQGVQYDFLSHVHASPTEEVREAGEDGVAEDPMVYRHERWVCVPLQCVWASPRVQDLCGDMQRLRQALLDDSQVQLDPDRDAIMLPDENEDEEGDKAEEDECVEGEWTMRAMKESTEEDWESEVGCLSCDGSNPRV
ncbi:small RNA 2'-O-methyltransferase isoform X2 [Hoplias malabaricus]|uniref:small RNA 2'-O-methyltransferase isoform X2 n=1 Tax=Hoplias malabaricus TaxID=27720 RepID=UPI003462464B